MNHSSQHNNRQIFETGTLEPATEAKLIQVGKLSALIDGCALRAITWQSVELVRQIDFPIRDQNWSTFEPKIFFKKFKIYDDSFYYEVHFEVDFDEKNVGALLCQIIYEGHSDGWVKAKGTATTSRDFITCRSGFTLLHPIATLSGKVVKVTNNNGIVEQVKIPKLISPAQPVKDISGLSLNVEGVFLDIAFEGDVFEMEDQRNWSDASFKTYCRPLAKPFPYEVDGGRSFTQKIKLDISGAAKTEKLNSIASLKIGSALAEKFPEMLLFADENALPDSESAKLISFTGFRKILLRVTHKNAEALLKKLTTLLKQGNGSFDLEILLEDDTLIIDQLSKIASVCSELKICPKHVIALPRDYLSSYQPDAQWPIGRSPKDAFEAAKITFPDAKIGGGMLTNFTELNRCRPDFEIDYITHSNSAIIHAADDTSVMQTLETLPQIFDSVNVFSGDKNYRLGLTAIGMRTNPYGDAVSPNPDQKRITMAMYDPRVRALFGAAWAIGALAATEGKGIDAISLSSWIGAFGIINVSEDDRKNVTNLYFDENSDAKFYPLFHVHKALLQIKSVRHTIDGLVDGLAGVAFDCGDFKRLIVANTNVKPTQFSIEGVGRIASLDVSSFAAAATNHNWIEDAFVPFSSTVVNLQPYSFIVFDEGIVDGE